MKALVIILTGSMVVAGGGALTFFLLGEGTPHSSRQETADGHGRAVATVAKGIGYVEPASEVRNLSFKTGGVIDKVHVELGQRVSEGDVLAVLDDVQAQAALAVAEAEWELARAQRERSLSGVNPHEISAAENALEVASERRSLAEREFERSRKLAPNGIKGDSC